MHGKRIPAWYWSRLELAIATVLVLLLASLVAWGLLIGFWEHGRVVQLGPILIEQGDLVPISALAVAVIGLAWMIRIMRGRIDDPPPWRYRDR